MFSQSLESIINITFRVFWERKDRRFNYFYKIFLQRNTVIDKLFIKIGQKSSKIPTIGMFIGVAIGICLQQACKPYKDPAPVDLGLTNPYCNDPRAINYNWGFPGKPDYSVCIYPSEAFGGTYICNDSIIDGTGASSFNAQFTVTLAALNDSTISFTGHCNPGGSYTMRATRTLQLIVDSTTSLGTAFCRYDKWHGE
jgi:hypothetical protein